MEFARELPKSFYAAKVGELFTDFYNAHNLRQLYQGAVCSALGRKPEAKSPVKAKLAEICLLLVGSPEKMETFVHALSPECRRAIQGLLWVKKAQLDEFEKEVGFEVVEKNENIRQGLWYEVAFVVKEGFPLIVLHRINDYHLGVEKMAEKSAHFLSLPPAVRAWLKPYFPKPDGYELRGVETLPAAASRKRSIFECARNALQSLAVTADFLQRGGVLRNKDGSVAKATVRKLAASIRGGEFYPDLDTPPRLALLRHELLVDLVDMMPGKTKAELVAAKVDVPGFLRDIPKLLASDPQFVAHTFLPHLKPYVRYVDPFEAGEAKLHRFIRLFRDLDATTWATRERLALYCRYRDLDGCFFESGQVEFRASSRATSYRNISVKRLDEDNMGDVLTMPLLSGLAFALAALGLVEIVCGEPRNPRYRADKEEFLSPFEGMEAVRLTALGAYAFGKTSELECSGIAPVGASLQFSPDRLLVRGEGIDPVTEAALRDYMQPIGPGLFKLTRTSFLKSCQSKSEVARHVQAFRQRIGSDLPPLWEAFFKGLMDESAALSREPTRTIFALAEDAAIRDAFHRDPVLRKLALKVEGWRVAIEEKELSKVRTRLRELGFFAY